MISGFWYSKGCPLLRLILSSELFKKEKEGHSLICLLSAVFAGSVTALQESSITSTCHMQTGDDLAAAGRTSSARSSSRLIQHWRILRGSAKTTRAGWTRWLFWDQRLHDIIFRSSSSSIVRVCHSYRNMKQEIVEGNYR